MVDPRTDTAEIWKTTFEAESSRGRVWTGRRAEWMQRDFAVQQLPLTDPILRYK